MRKRIFIAALCLVLLSACGQEPQNSEGAFLSEADRTENRQKPVSESKEESETPVSESEEESETSVSESEEESETSVSEQAAAYSKALTAEELDEVRALAEAFYEEFPYDLISLKLADDTYFGYEHYTDRGAGNVIIFLAETKHGGEGVYRSIVFARDDKNSKWVRVNEGY